MFFEQFRISELCNYFPAMIVYTLVAIVLLL